MTIRNFGALLARQRNMFLWGKKLSLGVGFFFTPYWPKAQVTHGPRGFSMPVIFLGSLFWVSGAQPGIKLPFDPKFKVMHDPRDFCVPAVGDKYLTVCLCFFRWFCCWSSIISILFTICSWFRKKAGAL